MIARLQRAACWGLGLVLVYAAGTKLAQPWERFALSVDSYRLLPEWGVIVVARTLPWLELLLGLLLLLGWRLRYVAPLVTALLAGFWVAMLWAYLQGLDIDCGCFGVGQAVGPATLVRDALLVALAGFVTVGAVRARPTSSASAA
ncbi:MAG: DoxX family protein [Firmicutes bacterium]|nr:DoxX family protein [Bacillota bacterium]